MTEWTDYRVSLAEELEQRCIDRWAELWKISGGIEPKFWFGDTAKFQQFLFRDKTLVLIVGMYWQDKDQFIRQARYPHGWAYRFLSSFDGSVHWAHEDELEAINTGFDSTNGGNNHD